jgi:hypothetical protein
VDKVTYFGLNEAFPTILMFCIHSQSCDLDEMLISTEKVELFEETIP